MNDLGQRHRRFVVLVLLALVAAGLPLAGGAPASASPVIPAQDPWIAAVTPHIGPESGGATVSISGKHLTGLTAVRFGGDAGTHLDVTSDTSLTVRTPAHTTGTYRVRLIAPGRSSARTARSLYTFVTTPDVTDVDPPVGPIGGGTTVSITGHGFTDATAVRFDGVPGTDLDVQDDSTITVNTPAGTAGAVRVRVIKRGSSSERSDAAAFTYAATPTVTGLTPAAGGSSQTTNVTIVGTGFIGVQSVFFGTASISSYEVVSSTEIDAVVEGQTQGAVDVTVVTAGGTTATSSDSTFTFLGTPYAYFASPSSGLSSGGTVVQLSGSNFTGVTAVRLNGVNASFTVNSSSQMTITTPASTMTGYATLQIVGPNGSSTNPYAFTYGAAPVITGISPSSGSTSGYDTVVITGTNVYPYLTSVTFGGVSFAQLISASANSVTVKTPPHASGTVDVVLSTSYGTSTLTNGYTYGP